MDFGERLNVRFSIKLLQTQEEIGRLIIAEITRKINAAISKAHNSIISRTQAAIIDRMVHSPEYISLNNGELAAHFGLNPGHAQTALAQIVERLVRSVRLDIVPLIPSTFTIKSGGLIVSAIQDDYSDLLSLPTAVVQSKKQNLPWLEWLLTRGVEIIIQGYEIKFDLNAREKHGSRSGFALMVEMGGGSWQVPPSFAGTIDDNWITRAMRGTEREIETFIQEEIEKKL